MSIIKTRTVSAVISRSEWAACAPAIKSESRRKSPRWHVVDVAGYGLNAVHLSLSVNGNHWRDLDDIFTAHVPGWEKMEV